MATGWGSVRRLFGAVALMALVSVTTMNSAAAQSNTGRVSLSAGTDLSHAYLFRGILQERSGAILQPYMDVTFTLFEGTEGFNSASVTVGQWNSLHNGPSGTGGTAEDVAAWYESDFYTGFGIGVDNWDFGITYTSYLSPNDTFGTVKELSFSLDIDDSEVLDMFPLSPHMVIAIELDGAADGSNEGVYAELGVEPALSVTDTLVSLSLPVTLGFSVSDYYEVLPGGDNFFGFFDVGVVASLPLPIPESYGEWGVSGGIHLMSLGETLTTINGGDGFQAVGVVGVSVGY